MTHDALTDNPFLVSDFRALLPEFSDSSAFVDEAIEPWLTIAAGLLNPYRWGNMYNMGMALFVAHQVLLQRHMMIAAQRGTIAGLGLGVVNSKSVNGVSVGYDTNISGLKDAGDWNLTIYGIRFLSFARMFGSGGVQIIAPDAIVPLPAGSRPILGIL